MFSVFCFLSDRGIHQTRRGIDVFDEQKHSYVDDADRALLKVIKYASPTSAGAEGVDPDCSWLELWYYIFILLLQQYILVSEIF